MKNTFGIPYGIRPDWPEAKVYAFCRDHPEVQAKMIADYIQNSYSKYGHRGPYAIQNYFWFEAYVRGWIGQGEWDKSVLAEAPGGDWRKLTPEMKANTGFYAKQVLVGHRGNPQGMLFWFWAAGDTQTVRETLRTWRDQKKMVYNAEEKSSVLSADPGGFAIQPGISNMFRMKKRGRPSRVWPAKSSRSRSPTPKSSRIPDHPAEFPIIIKLPQYHPFNQGASIWPHSRFARYKDRTFARWLAFGTGRSRAILSARAGS